VFLEGKQRLITVLAYFRSVMHQKNNVLIKRHMKSAQLKKLINFRFFVLICIAFLFPQLAFTTQQKTVGFTNLSSGISQINYFEKGTTSDQEPQLNLFVEAESEDEDDVHDEQAVCNGYISSIQNFKAVHFTGTINTLYLRLASNNLHKVDLPFFILYHSWKSHLA
jgi:hypothetical protein